ncbi:hypothetical protein LAZ67_21001696 [Cordylochernes scorpioides]|uniref:Uncharacterized protein n=1 Tax=Cordylochernes scorpioides TaxID=51811 RepID=A0ABY6LS30_9ARAC|nr:hypothetical protein LAZ67_21001696 [Cordylochernes scorpioides]
MLTVFFDYQGIVYHEFQQKGSTITADSYLGVLRRLSRSQTFTKVYLDHGGMINEAAPLHPIPLEEHELMEFERLHSMSGDQKKKSHTERYFQVFRPTAGALHFPSAYYRKAEKMKFNGDRLNDLRNKQ